MPTPYAILSKFLDSFVDGGVYRWSYFNRNVWSLAAGDFVASSPESAFGTLVTNSGGANGYRRLRFYSGDPVQENLVLDYSLVYGNGYITEMSVNGVNMPASEIARTYALNTPVDVDGNASGGLWQSGVFVGNNLTTSVGYSVTPRAMCLGHSTSLSGLGTRYCWSSDLSRGSVLSGVELTFANWQNYPYVGDGAGGYWGLTR